MYLDDQIPTSKFLKQNSRKSSQKGLLKTGAKELISIPLFSINKLAFFFQIFAEKSIQKIFT
jgi:hypothetical protein